MDDAKNKDASTSAVNRQQLFEVASGQAGYFTTQQARDCGISRALLAHHVKSGRYLREKRGLYRFREYPPSPREEVLAAWMAFRGADGVVSHVSALEMLNLSDVIPSAIHVTLPRSRRNLPSMAGVQIHTSSRQVLRSERTVRDGITLTTATRSILDSAEAGTAPEQIEMAVAQAVERGLSTSDDLRQRAKERSQRVATLIGGALAKMRP